MKHARLRDKSMVRKLYPIFQPIVLVLTYCGSRLKRSITGSTVQALLVDSKQGLFLVSPDDLGVGGALIKSGSYGEDEIERISSLTNSESRVLFVGTHIGALAIPISKKAADVTAIEANPNTFKLLSMNILLNQCRNINAIQVAASDKKGQLEFILSRTNSGGSKRMPLVRTYNYFYDRPNVVQVEADRLDSVLPENYDLIVMDIEGSEYFALKGMDRLLSNAAFLIVEFIPHHLKNVSCVTVNDFLEPLKPHFDRLHIPSKDLSVGNAQFLEVLEEMYVSDECDEGIVFSKFRP